MLGADSEETKNQDSNVKCPDPRILGNQTKEIGKDLFRDDALTKL